MVAAAPPPRFVPRRARLRERQEHRHEPPCDGADGAHLPTAVALDHRLVVRAEEPLGPTPAPGEQEELLGRALVLSAMGDLVRGEFTAGGSPLPFMPPARVGGGLRWERSNVRFSGEVRHGFAQDRVTGGSADVATDAYTLLNLSAGRSWLMGHVMHQVTLRADNATDARYFDAASRIKRFAANPGRNFSLIYQVLF